MVALFLTACQKELSENNNFNVYTNHPLNDTAWTQTLSASASVHALIQLLKPNIIIDSLDASKDTTMVYGDSLSVFFKSGVCTETGGAPATSGLLRLEIFRLRTKGDYIKAFKATTSNGYLLEAAGAFFVRVTREGRELSLAQGASLKINFSDNTEPRPNMQVFNGREGNPIPASGIDTAFSWQRDSDTSWIPVFQRTAATTGTVIRGYEMPVKNLRWTGAERYIDSTAPKTRIFALLPPNYTNKNTAAFAVFANQKTIVNLKAEYSSRTFAASNIPRGTKLKVITISRIGGDTYLGVKDVNDVGTNTNYFVTPEKKSIKDILAFLDGL
ncbi:hypothetical protein GWC94_04085 [Sediminibacterium sp. WSJ-3]|nr:hypothetical protein [Sediminibacterium soli]